MHLTRLHIFLFFLALTLCLLCLPMRTQTATVTNTSGLSGTVATDTIKISPLPGSPAIDKGDNCVTQSYA